MDENKNLTPEDENIVPEEAGENNEIISDAEASAPEEVSETTSSEEAEEEIKEEAEALEFASEEEASEDEAPAPKKKKNGIFVAIAAIVVILIAAAAFLFSGSGSSEGTGNLVSQGFATVKGNYLYHVDFNDLKMHKTSLRTGESEVVTDDYAVYISNYKNNIYYMGYDTSEDGSSFVYEYKKYVDGTNDIVIISDTISSPQLADGYLYYLKSVPEFHSGYSSRLYRVSLNGGGEPEVVCDALMISYLVNGDDLYYCDVETTSLLKVSVKKSVQLAAASPLGENEKRASSELEPETLSQAVVTCMAISGKTLYFIDAQTGTYTLYTFDLKNNTVGTLNNGVNAASINIYGKFLYYYNTADFSIYRMNLDGSDVLKITEPGYGYMALSGDKFLSMEFTDNYEQYIAVCDLDGNVIMEVGLPDESEEEDYYDDYAESEVEEDVEEDGEAVQNAGSEASDEDEE